MAKQLKVLFLFFCFLSTTYSCVLEAGQSFTKDNVGPITMKKEYLESTKTQLSAGDSIVTRAFDNLIEKANAALDKGPYSVINKNLIPPSGNKHDYMSLATYAWPNPETETGLPYIYKDGHRNPEVDKFDRTPLARMANYSRILGLAYYFSGEEKYAEHAARLIRHWFLNEDTYMKPNFKYTQVIPGVNEGSGQGIVESRDLVQVIDAVALIFESDHWSERDQWELKVWFDNFLSWIQSNYSPTYYRNNIGTWYDLQIASFALFSENFSAITYSKDIKPTGRVSAQITAEGSQPLELSRWKAQHYTYFNLKGLITLAITLSNRDIDLWNYSPEGDSGSMRNALDWLLPYAMGTKEWDFEQVEPFNECRYIELYRPAALIYNLPKYETVVKHLLSKGCNAEETFLLYPEPNF